MTTKFLLVRNNSWGKYFSPHKKSISYCFSKLADPKMQKLSFFFVLADFYSNKHITQLKCKWMNELLLGRNEHKNSFEQLNNKKLCSV